MIYALGFGLILMLAGIFSYGQTTALTPHPLAVVKVERGEGLGRVLRRMEKDHGVSRRFLRLLAVLRGDSTRIKAGEFVVQGPVSSNQLLNLLISGESRIDRLTIPEGYNLMDISAKLEQRGIASGRKFLEITHNPRFIAKLNLPEGFSKETLEGLIFPETYYFSAGVDEREIAAHMVGEFTRRAMGEITEGGSPSGLTPYQILILASIIEKETGVGSERPLISAVFHNRLKINMPLATDPTVIYGVKDFNGNLTREHLQTPSAYNTYINQGLPPTPIANPGLESIRAAMNPARVKYLFFVGKGDGTHFFSSDYKTHSQAVFKYQVLPNRKRKH